MEKGENSIDKLLDGFIENQGAPKTKNDYKYLETIFILKAANANGLIEARDKNVIAKTLERGNDFAMTDLNLKYDEGAYEELVEDVYGAVEEIRMWVEVGWLENDKKTINKYGMDVLKLCDTLQDNLENLSIAHLEYVYGKLLAYKELSTMELTNLLETFSETKSRSNVDKEKNDEYLRKAYEMRVMKNRAKE